MSASVTVCITAFGYADLLPQALSSVVCQTVAPRQVLVIDDGSSPEEARKLKEITVSRGYEYRWITNRRLAGARNAGLMAAQGNWFIPLDADDEIGTHFIEKTLARAQETGARVVQVGIQERGVRTGYYQPGFDMPLEDVTPEIERQMNRVYYCGLYSTELLRSVGGYNAMMSYGYEDWDLHIDLMRRGVKYAAVNEPLLFYRTSADGMLAETERLHRQRNIDEIARHHP